MKKTLEDWEVIGGKIYQICVMQMTAILTNSSEEFIELLNKLE